MRLLAARMLFVLACLTTPQFIESGRIFFRPSVNLWTWGNEAFNGYSINNPDFLWNVLALFAIPALIAGWFAFMDMLRLDTRGIQPRSKYALALVIPAFSWVCLVVAIAYSINNHGLLYAPYRWFTEINPSIYGTAFALLVIEYLTYFIAYKK